MNTLDVIRDLQFEQQRCAKLAVAYNAWAPEKADTYRRRAELFRCAVELLKSGGKKHDQ